MDRSDILIQVKNLSLDYKVYGGYLKVLDGVSFSVRENEKVGLIGETGCGKTTTMKAILGLLSPNAHIRSGEIFFEGKDILKMDKKSLNIFRRQRMAMIFQEPMIALNPVFTIGQQIRDVIRYANSSRLSDREINERARSVLKNVSLSDVDRILNNYPFQLSGGMRQRICIALAIAMAQKLLIADEPTTALDVTIQDQILRLIDTISKEKEMSLILITHSLGLTRKTTQRMYVMYAGTMIESCNSLELYENPLHPYTRGLLKSLPRLTGGGFSDGIPGRLPEYLNPPPGCRFYDRCPHAMPVCNQQKPPVIEIEKDHEVACFLYIGKEIKNNG
jgi:peptide/nickel transport system ATP-binding protein